MLTATEYALAPFAAVGLVTIVSKLHDTFRFFLRDRDPAMEGHDNFGRPEVTSGVTVPLGGGLKIENVERSYEIKRTGDDQPNNAFAYFVDGDEMELVQHGTGKVLKRLWEKKDCYATEQNPPLAQVPPNMGSDAVPYAGPNYVSDEDLAEEMKGLIHFFGEPEPGYFDDPVRLGHRLGGDLAWDFKGYGLVAADGAIWVAPDERVHSGIVLMQASEMGKAARFGWTYERESNGNSNTVWVRREHGA